MSKQIAWKLGTTKIKHLIDYDKNPVVISDRAAKELARNLKEKGQDLPYVIAAPLVKDRDVPLLDGHQRKNADLTFNNADPNKLVPVLYPDRKLTEREKQEWIVTHRKNVGTWDADSLLESFKTDDLLSFGFERWELSAIGFEFEDGNDPNEEWEGMPEFEQNKKEAFRTIIIHFDNQEAIDNFAELTKLSITEKTRFIWFPEKQKRILKDLAYKNES